MAKQNDEKVKKQLPEKHFFKAGITPEEKAKLITDAAIETDNQMVKIEFTADEIIEKRKEQTEIATSIMEIEKEKKSVVSDYTSKLKPLKDKQEKILIAIREGHDFENMTLYKLIDLKNGMVGYYDIEGNLRMSRPTNKEERQARIDTEGIFEDESLHG